ncbi:hypothetical protein [Bradyrhizobium japonicum]|uniref:hypothetical protein n=1 Tax=Bradyrhizobium japonicum TaxID=375 RepID=UPI001BA751AC|nr:hypothetical protein [Bradyrhizobium japonicum]MBR0760720.1 hypothetical protein [Bradyrhizobium japonicum]
MTVRLLCIETTPAPICVPPGVLPPQRAYSATKGGVIDVPGDINGDAQTLLSARDPLPGGMNYFILLGQSGPTSARPSYPALGQAFIDTTVGSTLFYDGASWRDITGTSR